MKAIFITYNQAYYTQLAELLAANGCKGYTKWNDIAGNGSAEGEPHLGDHAWPTMNDAVWAMVPDDIVDTLLDQIRAIDEATPALGLRAFVWNIEKFY